MTNEAVLYFEVSPPVFMTCTNATGVERGTLLKLSDPNTVAIHAATDDVVGGVASGEKIASDGLTSVGVYRGQGNWFKVTASGSITVGDSLGLSLGGDNKVYNNRATANLSGSRTIGTAMETATDGETFLMELNIQCTAGL
jgi:hypothetical protein